MSLESDFAGYLAAQTAITNLVSTRTYAVHLPENPTYPAITYQKISSTHEHDLDGAAGSAIARIQVNAWATKYIDSVSVGDAIRTTLDGYKGTMGSTSVAFITLQNQIDLPEKPVGGNADWLYHRALDFTIHYHE